MKQRKALQSHNKKTSWSAPATMAAVFLVGMLLIFSFESLGLAKRELNLEHRSKIQVHTIQSNLEKVDTVTSENILKYKVEKSKEEKLDKIYRILQESANEQEYINNHVLMLESHNFN